MDGSPPLADPARVLFAHDLAVHERDVADLGTPRAL
jgi:hypothetical protein